MRPQLFAAEHVRGGDDPRVPHRASMRPQLFAAEHRALRGIFEPETPGFNEAAAIRCGTLRLPGTQQRRAISALFASTVRLAGTETLGAVGIAPARREISKF